MVAEEGVFGCQSQEMFFKGQRPYYIVVGLIPGLINKKSPHPCSYKDLRKVK